MELREKGVLARFAAPMIDEADPDHFKSGETVADTAYYRDAGGSWTSLAITDTFSEIGSTGVYEIDLSATEMAHDEIVIKMTSTNGQDNMISIKTEIGQENRYFLSEGAASNGVGTRNSPFNTLANAISGTPEGAEIIMIDCDESIAGSVHTLSDRSLIGRSLMFMYGTNSGSELIRCNSRSHLENIAVYNLSSDSNSRAVYINEKCSVKNCLFQSSASDYSGHIQGSYVTVENVSFNKGLYYLIATRSIIDRVSVNGNVNGSMSLDQSAVRHLHIHGDADLNLGELDIDDLVIFGDCEINASATGVIKNFMLYGELTLNGAAVRIEWAEEMWQRNKTAIISDSGKHYRVLYDNATVPNVIAKKELQNFDGEDIGDPSNTVTPSIEIARVV